MSGKQNQLQLTTSSINKDNDYHSTGKTRPKDKSKKVVQVDKRGCWSWSYRYGIGGQSGASCNSEGVAGVQMVD